MKNLRKECRICRGTGNYYANCFLCNDTGLEPENITAKQQYYIEIVNGLKEKLTISHQIKTSQILYRDFCHELARIIWIDNHKCQLNQMEKIQNQEGAAIEKFRRKFSY